MRSAAIEWSLSNLKRYHACQDDSVLRNVICDCEPSSGFACHSLRVMPGTVLMGQNAGASTLPPTPRRSRQPCRPFPFQSECTSSVAGFPARRFLRCCMGACTSVLTRKLRPAPPFPMATSAPRNQASSVPPDSGTLPARRISVSASRGRILTKT